MNVFDLRNRLISDYSKYISSFINIRDERIRAKVDEELNAGLLWPDPLIQMNPSFQAGDSIEELINGGILHPECGNVFRLRKEPGTASKGIPLKLYKHQSEAIKFARKGHSYVLTTGTGSGKSLAYIVPIVDHVLRIGSGGGIKAVVVFPMNALANSQKGELEKFLCNGYPDGKGPVTFARYTGQEKEEERNVIIGNPPDILLTNYVMLELILTRPQEKPLVEVAKGLRFLVLDELHTYRGRQGADVAMLARRARDAFGTTNVQFVGTSATLAGEGNNDEQRAEIASVASTIFGTGIEPENVIGETLRRATPETDLSDPSFIPKLKQRIQNANLPVPNQYQEFIKDPLSIWLEGTLGVTKEEGTDRLIRAKPLSLSGENGAAQLLSEKVSLPESDCSKAIEKKILDSYRCELPPDVRFPIFAFRLHQFISRGDTVYASPESEKDRYLTVQGQQYVPGDRARVLLPLVFCRECGQEYYCVRSRRDEETGLRVFTPRALDDQHNDNEEGEAGFLFMNTSNPWPDDIAEVREKLPDDWLEEHRGQSRVRRERRKNLPQLLTISPAGNEAENGTRCHCITAPFRFCPTCEVSYDFRLRSDFTKLTSLATEGRSTATTILSLSTIKNLRKEESLEKQARKLLSFTDNRQDASLQAGHFNDFIEIGLLRSALYKAALAVGPNGLRHDELVQKVFDALNLPIDLYASDPAVRFQALEETKRALRSVFGYRLYRDLKRGWRVTAPNLEQCGLLEIQYLSLEDVCHAEDIWEGLHPALATATPETRINVAKTLLDFMRRGLAIKIDFLQPEVQERIQQLSSQRLKAPWAIDENEQMEHSAVLYPRPARRDQDYGGDVFLSPRGGFGQYIRRRAFPYYQESINLDQAQHICRQLLEALRPAGLIEVVREPRNGDDVPGYQLPASALLWIAGDGTKSFHDPIRVPRMSTEGGRTNPFFVEFYKTIAADGIGLEAREHTAQVKYDLRIDREERFGEGTLPILYCSPTMELGVDIKELNAVNMRNIPPTAANYAQRSGRAGRSGQPALIFSYCSTYRPHDQYFFKRPELMVSGAVTPPRLDLSNEDLIRAHVHSIWLKETKIALGSSLVEVLDVGGENPSLELQDRIRDAISDDAPKQKAKERAKRILAGIQDTLAASDWYSDGWLDEVFSQITLRFERACDRWRDLYRAAERQRALQHSIISDASKGSDEKKRARRLRAEAEAQIELLTEAQKVMEADFYSYRYFASEGFLPGYNFPRLPLSAYIPGRRQKTERDEFLSRPRFLAISEFGPRTIVYHEGSRYRINRVILPVDERSDGADVATTAAKQCGLCGYLHLILKGDGPDLCERCNAPLGAPLRSLFRLQNVSTKRTEKISSDEEERMRFGFELKTAVRFAERGGSVSYRTARIAEGENELGKLIYGHAATLWRINLGWARRANHDLYGFVLDVERGYWAKNEQDAENDEQDPLSKNTRRVIPYVEDRKNCLIFEPSHPISVETMASLQAALKNAIQVVYQLEDSELAAEPLPLKDDRRLLLFYEAAEGGAGVLRRLLDDPHALARVGQEALQICHFDPATGSDLRRAARSREDCEAACYDCLMSYMNQQDHRILDRHKVHDILMKFSRAHVETSPSSIPRSEHLIRLERQCESGLEKQWLQFLESHDLKLPSRAQAFFAACDTRPDFIYDDCQVVVYVDGPHHDYPDRQARDKTQTVAMEDQGYTVLRFGLQDDWKDIIRQHPNVFGSLS